MGIIVNKNQNQDNEITRRINADLRERAMQTTGEGDSDLPDLAEDSEYVKTLKKTSKFGWIWIVLIILAIISVGFIVFPGV